MMSRRSGSTFLFGISLTVLLVLSPGCGKDTSFDGIESGGGGEEPLPAVELVYTDDFEWVANTPRQVPFGPYGAFYRPVAPDGFHALGHYGQLRGEIVPALDAPCGWMFVARELEPGALAEPLDYELIGEPASDCSFWKPIPPPGYVGLGFVAQAGSQKPDTDEIRCLREDLTAPGNLGKTISQADGGYSVKQIVPEDEDGIYIRSFAYVAPDPPLDEFFCIHEAFVQKEELSQEDVEELVEQYGPLLFF